MSSPTPPAAAAGFRLPGRRVLVAYAAWVVLVTVVVVAAAAAFTVLRPASYSASAVVTLTQHLADGTPVTPDMGTEAEVVKSGAVAGLAADALGVTTTDVQSSLSVTVPEGTHVMNVTYVSASARTAQLRANAVASAYALYRNRQDAAAARASRSKTRLVTTASILSSAPLPSAPANRHWKLTLGAALVLGLALGAGVVFVRDRLDDRVRDAADVARSTGLRPLGTVAPDDTGGLSRTTEDYRRLRAQVLAEAVRRDARVLLLAGTDDHGRCGQVALLLSAALARSGRSVVLVGVDPSGDAVLRPWATGPGDDLVTALAAGAGPDEHHPASTPVPGLSVLPAGSAVDLPDLLAGPGTARLLDRLAAESSLVVLAGGDAARSAGPAALGPVAGLTVVVATTGSSRLPQVAAAVRDLVDGGADVAGFVLATATRRHGPFFRRRAGVAVAAVEPERRPTAVTG